MESIYQEMWNLAKPYYEKGRPIDAVHVKLMMKLACRVCEKEKIDDTLLLPLVILHDIGYAEAPQVYFEKEQKKEHMIVGARIAAKILDDLNYPAEKTKKIVDYIKVHDHWLLGDDAVYDNIIISTFTDLDFIWMATKEGFALMQKVLNKNPSETLEFIENNEKLIKRPFATKTTKELFYKYLNERKMELRDRTQNVYI